MFQFHCSKLPRAVTESDIIDTIGCALNPIGDELFPPISRNLFAPKQGALFSTELVQDIKNDGSLGL
jgi:hypothetical protein